MTEDEQKKAREEALEMIKDHKNLMLIALDENKEPPLAAIAIGNMPGNMRALYHVLGTDHALSKMMWTVIRKLLEEGTVTLEDDGIIIDSLTEAKVIMDHQWPKINKRQQVPVLHYGKPGKA